ncbi:MAG: hypothetical protein WCP85_17980 [Mariniphaga sp.]
MQKTPTWPNGVIQGNLTSDRCDQIVAVDVRITIEKKGSGMGRGRKESGHAFTKITI